MTPIALSPVHQRSLLPGALLDRLSGTLAGSGEPTATMAPFTGAPLATLPTSTPDDIRQAFARARAAQSAWAATPPRERAKPFLALHDSILNHRELIDVVQAETGKARNSAFEETVDIAGLALYYGRRAPAFLAPRRRRGAIPLATRSAELRHAKGVVAIISPWNYPLSLGLCDAIPALLAGNAVVHKPDTQTALTALRTRELLIDCGLPAELWQIVVGDPGVIGDALIDGADHVCFTGSTNAGRRIAKAAAERLIGCTLELGGKNPMLVLDDANLDKAAAGAVRAFFSSAGQLCLSMERIYIADAVYNEFLAKMLNRTREIKLGNEFDWTYDVGTLTSQRQLDIVELHVADAVAKGATILAGGTRRPDLGPFFYEPTILSGVTPEMNVYADETFGPVVSVFRVGSDEEAIQRANDSDFGLNASVWTTDTDRGRRVAQRIRCGTVNINEGVGSAYTSNDAPMGGMKASGQGRRHGEHGLLEFVELQRTLRNVDVGIARTLPKLDPRREVREVEALNLAAIAAARHTIYLEIQYLAARRIVDALAARLKEDDGPEIVIILPRRGKNRIERETMDGARHRLVQVLWAADEHRRLGVYWPVTDGGAPIYVHSKVLVVDDRLLRIGSSNLNNRSMGFDSECDVAVEPDSNSTEHDDVRRQVTSLRHQLVSEHLGVSVDEFERAMLECRSFLKAIEAVRGHGRTLRPFTERTVSDEASALAETDLMDPDHVPRSLSRSVQRLITGLRGWTEE